MDAPAQDLPVGHRGGRLTSVNSWRTFPQEFPPVDTTPRFQGKTTNPWKDFNWKGTSPNSNTSHLPRLLLWWILAPFIPPPSHSLFGNRSNTAPAFQDPLPPPHPWLFPTGRISCGQASPEHDPRGPEQLLTGEIQAGRDLREPRARLDPGTGTIPWICPGSSSRGVLFPQGN